MSSSSSSSSSDNSTWGFGDNLVPFADPAWYSMPAHLSPFYDESHRRVRAAMREWVRTEIEPHVDEWDDPSKMCVPADLPRKAFEAGWLASTVLDGNKYFPDAVWIGGVPARDWTPFHSLVMLDELARAGSAGLIWNITGGLSIGIPPVLHYGTQRLKDMVMPCLRGEKRICLAITEATAGSDVSAIKTTAVLTPDKRHYIVNGQKKWITNGIIADFFTVALNTENGISLLLVERGPGVVTQKMPCMGVHASGTSRVIFENCQVPVENIIGVEGFGLLPLLMNLNTERWGTIVMANRFARVCLEEALLFATKREVFGQKLIKNQMIVHKIANAVKHVEATHAWIETATYSFWKMDSEEKRVLAAGTMALLKAQATQTMELCAREAAQILGGLSYSRGGQGAKVERLYREVRAMSIPAGSEELMLMLGLSEGFRNLKRLKERLQAKL